VSYRAKNEHRLHWNLCRNTTVFWRTRQYKPTFTIVFRRNPPSEVADFARCILISLRFHLDFTSISLGFHLNFIVILLRFHLDFIRISLGSLLGFPLDFTRNYPRILLNGKVTLLYMEGYLQNKRVNEYSTKDFIRIVLRFHWDFTRVSVGFHQDFTRIS
jgi:hypothetical protein